MTMTSGLRRLTYTAHVTSSIGWFGAVLVFLALSAIGLTSHDERTVRGAYLVMAPAAWFVLVPLAHASLLSGIALSLGTTWGLLRHYWVAIKLAITVFATAILLIYMGTFREMASLAADPIVPFGEVRNPSPLVHSILALMLLILATVLAVYKPSGMTAYGRRKEASRRDSRQTVSLTTAGVQLAAARAHMGRTSAHDAVTGSARWLYLTLIVAAALLVLLMTLHLLLGGAVGH